MESICRSCIVERIVGRISRVDAKQLVAPVGRRRRLSLVHGVKAQGGLPQILEQLTAAGA